MLQLFPCKGLNYDNLNLKTFANDLFRVFVRCISKKFNGMS